jgi:hypothetical protein
MGETAAIIEELRAIREELVAMRNESPVPGLLPHLGRQDYRGVYFVQDELTGYIKIGYAANIPSRVSTLRIGNPHGVRLVGVLNGWKREEQALHDRFREYQRSGEWFRPARRLVEFILALPPYEDQGGAA